MSGNPSGFVFIGADVTSTEKAIAQVKAETAAAKKAQAKKASAKKNGAAKNAPAKTAAKKKPT